MIIDNLRDLKSYMHHTFQNTFVFEFRESVTVKNLDFVLDKLYKNLLKDEDIKVEFFNINFVDCNFKYIKDVKVWFCNCNFNHCGFFIESTKHIVRTDYNNCNFNNCSIGDDVIVGCMRYCNFDFSNTWHNRYKWITDFSGTYMFHPFEYLNEYYEKTTEGYIVYKIFNLCYRAPERWKIEPNSIITETVNLNMDTMYVSGIYVSTLKWLKDESIFWEDREFEVWKCLIRYEWSMGICVPYNTDGSFRCGKLQLLESRKFTGVTDLINNIETAFN